MARRNGRTAAVAAAAMAAVVWSGGAGLAQTAPPGAGPDPARAEAIRGAPAAIGKRLAAHGGILGKWAEDLKPYRDGIRGVAALKWPWPAKNGYVFQGATHAPHLRDSFDDLPGGERPLEGLVHFSRQFKAPGIGRIVAIIPAPAPSARIVEDGAAAK